MQLNTRLPYKISIGNRVLFFNTSDISVLSDPNIKPDSKIFVINDNTSSGNGDAIVIGTQSKQDGSVTVRASKEIYGNLSVSYAIFNLI